MTIEAQGYSIHVVCDNDHMAKVNAGERIYFGFMGTNQGAGPTKSDCIKQLKRKGWTFKRDGKTYCPLCSKRKSPTPPYTDIDSRCRGRQIVYCQF